jgi:hypothetical protein
VAVCVQMTLIHRFSGDTRVKDFHVHASERTPISQVSYEGTRRVRSR